MAAGNVYRREHGGKRRARRKPKILEDFDD
jgi:hypothetical protein